MDVSPGAQSDLPYLRVLPILVGLLWAWPAAGQPAPGQPERRGSVASAEADSAANPLSALNDEVGRVLADAGVPISPDQERAIALMMEERRRASEELFGDLMDFRSGPTQGQEQDRLRSAIDWMRGEFLRNLADYLTEPQKVAWDAHLEQQAAAGTDETPAAQRSEQTQYVRINNNAFTAENNGFNAGSSTDVVQRGGAGAWHGNAQFLLKDDALNARNAFAGNKPPYQERRLSVDVSGPAIPGRLSSGIAFQQTESENVGTIRATLPEGIFALGITRPNLFRNIQVRNTYQAADAHSIRTFVRRESETSRDQGIGGFSLPERRSDAFRSQWSAGVFPFSALSSTSIHEARFELNMAREETVPFSEAVRINVLDAFSGGGAQNRSEETNRRFGFGNMYTRLGDRITLKTGFSGNYRVRRSVSTENFGGTFTFSNLDAYLAARPLTYRVTRGTPDLETRQLEGAGFVQTDVSMGSQLTLLFGARYEAQQNVSDYNNLDPRVGFAYAPGGATVIRGGGGIFHRRLEIWLIENQRRLDGTRQFEIVIDDPSYPDPFAAGTRRETFPSVRITDPDLALPYSSIAMLSLERTFFSNLLVTATYDFQREYHRLRLRNLNAPFDSRFEVRRSCTAETPQEACLKPDPRRGNVIALESAGKDVRHGLRLSVRKRFSIFNGQLSYQGQRVYGDVQGGDIALISDAYNPSADWGRAPMPTHQINGTLNASLPLGIFVSGDMAFRSGRYYTVTTGTDDNRDSSVNDRPAGVAPNTERGPNYMNVDFNISKAFFFGGSGGTSGTNINVFANMTNAFNHVHYGTPSGVMTSPNFRRITSASDPREIEVGLRFQF
jgi:hypothetical protein